MDLVYNHNSKQTNKITSRLLIIHLLKLVQRWVRFV